MPKGVRAPGHIRIESAPINAGSKCQTPASLQVDLRYAELRIWDRWSWDRFSRLANFLNVTAAELASIACIPHRHLPAFQQRNRLFAGASPSYAAAMLLTLIEAWVCKDYTSDVITNPLADLPRKNEDNPSRHG